MSAIINTSIPPQNFEVIRNLIVAILGVELRQQYTLNNAYPNIETVWGERFIPINSETECPTVNVSIAKDEFDNETIFKTIGAVVYNIDIYTTAMTSIETGNADQYAMVTMTKIAGMVRAILMYPEYKTLGIDGIIQETTILKYAVLDKSSVQDALSTVVGRIQFMVKCEEVNGIPDLSVPIKELTTTSLLNGSSFGYFYDYRQQTIQINATGPTITNSFFSNPINEINLLDTNGNTTATYLLNTDFTQSGTTITATTFTFTSGTKIIAKT